MQYKVLFKRLHPNAHLPEYQTPLSVGADAYAVEECLIDPGQVVAVPLGFAVALPQEVELQVRPRSGLALKKGVTVLNSPGTIDPDFRNEVKVILINFGKEIFTVQPGMRIAQLVLAEFSRSLFVEVEELPPSTFRTGGFGSTGV